MKDLAVSLWKHDRPHSSPSVVPRIGKYDISLSLSRQYPRCVAVHGRDF